MSQQQLSVPLLPVLEGGVLPSPTELAIFARSVPLVIPFAALKSAFSQLKPKGGNGSTRQQAYIVSLDETSTESAASDILNDGAEVVFTPNGDLLEHGLPAERVVLSISPDTALPLSDFLEKHSDLAGLHVTLPAGLQASSAQAGELLASYSKLLDTKKTGKALFVSLSAGQTASVEDVKLLASTYSASLLVASTLLSFSENVDQTPSDKLDFATAFFSPLGSDRTDGLFPTIVTSTLGQSLGLVYSSQASLRASLLSGCGTYQSRNRGLWQKGLTSGATQHVRQIRFDCDFDAIEFRVTQNAGKNGESFCHLPVRDSCFGPLTGLERLQHTIQQRKRNAPAGSYTARLFSDEQLLGAKIREEAQELIDAKDVDKEHVAFEMADLMYFAFVRCAKAGVTLEDVEEALEGKAKKVQRRKGDAKPAFVNGGSAATVATAAQAAPASTEQGSTPAPSDDIKMASYRLSDLSPQQKIDLLKRPSIKSGAIMDIARPILSAVRERGDAALLEYTAKFDRCSCLKSPVRFPPFVDDEVMRKIKPEVKNAIDVAYRNIHAFHKAQKATTGNKKAEEAGCQAAGITGAFEDAEDAVLEMETQPGVVCRRFARPIQRVGLYVPGGTAVLPSTALMLGVPAKVAKCPTIVLATPPRQDGSIAPEVLYVASLVGATCILAAGGAQAVAAMAYGTETVPKVDKIVGPGNQFVTAAKMIVQNETDTLVSIDMPAGPSEVLVIADASADPAFVASDLLSQAEHGPDSQVVLVAIALNESQLKAIERELDTQAKRLPRVGTVRKAIEKSVTIVVNDRKQAIDWSNAYAPEHLILQVEDAEEMVKSVENAGSVFVGMWSPESCGDYASGTNHTLPTYGFARQYSGVSTSTFEKHITSQSLTSEGLQGLGPHVVHLAECEGLEAHAQAVRVRLQALQKRATA
ncbi:hypothetical protein K437DRAFT_248094 [Tilletiaria anomala UBC 951]|uniref:Histidine biosynthesis trifunctional protein n=1 Tax=Tilletiaria anomala (strain ATCC 24038 / CBS 436.72 / UBC 951) TaxID=1037660 RepID=A0A066VUJ8_TILAU|nr:uncharacterized protein K437DRAFT_248094 [Tilletiaria anomala UBC 951]KDN43943.1 hypothetical protein K437DRAFT_248094 [Tilletiaria anomala UBC 951]